MDENDAGKKNVSLTKEVIEIEFGDLIRETMSELHKFGMKQVWEISPDIMGLISSAKNMSNMFGYVCES